VKLIATTTTVVAFNMVHMHARTWKMHESVIISGIGPNMKASITS